MSVPTFEILLLKGSQANQSIVWEKMTNQMTVCMTRPVKRNNLVPTFSHYLSDSQSNKHWYICRGQKRCTHLTSLTRYFLQTNKNYKMLHLVGESHIPTWYFFSVLICYPIFSDCGVLLSGVEEEGTTFAAIQPMSWELTNNFHLTNKSIKRRVQ